MELLEARRRLFQLAKETPTTCPCCGQLVALYPRQIYSTMARALITMYVKAGREWFHLPTVLGHGGDAAKLRYWGLIEESAGTREDGGRKGWWRITDDGEAFVKRRLTVPKFAYVFNKHVQRLDGPHVDIQDCLGSRFDLRELLTTEGCDLP